MNDIESVNASVLKRSAFASVFEIDFSIKIFGQEIFHFHYPPSDR